MAGKTLPRGYDIAWEGLSFDEAKRGNEAVYIFLVVLVFVYMVLAAQYESFLLPLAVILSLPAGVFGSFLLVKSLGVANDIFAQVGLVMLVGLLGKNAVLIVEFAVQTHRNGATVFEAAVQGAKERFRPILMTSFAFIAGLIPLLSSWRRARAPSATAPSAPPPWAACSSAPSSASSWSRASISSSAPSLISSFYDLLSFTPNTGTFARIGRVNCLEGTPNSMALDRYGTAWVNYSSGALYKVSTADASCERTAYQPGQGGFAKFGMALSSTTAANDAEQLFVNGLEDGKHHRAFGLGSIDIETLKLSPIGQFTGALAGQNAELTGTGDARLFGFLTTQPNATLAEIDKTTGATSNARVLDGVSTGNAWASSYSGGDFWFYTAQAGDETSTVTRLALSGDGSLSKVTTNADLVVKTSGMPFHIVGAGVSTCAPLEPPK